MILGLGNRKWEMGKAKDNANTVLKIIQQSITINNYQQRSVRSVMISNDWQWLIIMMIKK